MRDRVIQPALICVRNKFLDSVSKFEGKEPMEEQDLNQIEAMMSRVVGVFAEDVQHKFEILSEGHQLLSEKLNRVETRIEQVESTLIKRIDALAPDLYSHRADTEAHQGVWRVKES